MLPVHLVELDTLTPLQAVVDKHPQVFKDELGCMEGVKINLDIDDTVKPKFFKPCSVPFTLRKKVEAELDRLQAMGVISPVKSSQWAAPIVPVVKKDGRVRTDEKITAIKEAPTPRNVTELRSFLGIIANSCQTCRPG